MVNHDDIHWFKNVLKKQINIAMRFYISAALIISPFFLINKTYADDVPNIDKVQQTQQARSDYATRAKELEEKYIKQVQASAANNAKVNSSLSTSETSKTTGGKVVGKASTTAAVDAKKVGDVLGRRAKKAVGGPWGFVGSVALNQLIDAIGWVIDEGGKVTKVGEAVAHTCKLDGSDCIYTQKIYTSNVSGIASDSAANNCILSAAFYSSRSSLTYTYVSHTSSVCQTSVSDGSTLNFGYSASNNKYYDSTATAPVSTSIEVNKDEIAQKISDRVSSTNDALSQQLIQDAYSHDSSSSVSAPENALSTEQANKLTDALQQAAKAESGTYTSADGTTTASVQPVTNASTSTGEATTTNPDGTTSATSIEQTIEWPAVCDYAAFLCEWWQWTQEKYDEFMEDQEAKQPEKLEIEVPDFNADDVTLTGSNTCPQDSVSFSLMGRSYTLQMPYQPVCDALEFFRPAVLMVGAITSAYIVAGIRTKDEEE